LSNFFDAPTGAPSGGPLSGGGPAAGQTRVGSMLRSVILAAAGSDRIERLLETAPVSRGMVRRYVAGSDVPDALRVTAELLDDGLSVTLDHLAEGAGTPAAVRDAYVQVLAALAGAGYGARAEVSLQLSALGLADDERLAYRYAREICQAATNAGTAVTVDAEDHTTADAALDLVLQLRKDFPDTGAVLQAYLRRTEADCKELSYAGSRVRLCKGAYAEPETVAFQSRLDVDRSFVRCLNILMGGAGRPLVATHDPRLVAIAEDRAKWFDRAADSFEFQMWFGVRPDEQRRLAAAGYPVRVYVPYGEDWYRYLVRRLASRR
jgi:proline dehydrogenase